MMKAYTSLVVCLNVFHTWPIAQISRYEFWETGRLALLSPRYWKLFCRRE